MNAFNELNKLGISPDILSREEYEKHYANLYNVLAYPNKDLYWVVKDTLLLYQLRKALEKIK